MKRLLCALALMCFIIINVFSFSVSAKEISLYVNDNKIECDSPPVIKNDRTLVPVRVIMESLGADVKWNELTRAVTISRNNTSVILTINSKKAKVGTVLKFLDCEPVIINNLTFVPVRFIAETFDFNVIWDSENHAVRILPGQNPTTPEIDAETDEDVSIENNNNLNFINTVTTSHVSGRFLLTITADSPVSEYKIFPLSAPERIVLDLKDCSYNNTSAMDISRGGITSVRFGPQDYGLRIVVDITAPTTYDLKVSSDKQTFNLYINNIENTTDNNSGNDANDTVVQPETPDDSTPSHTETEKITSVVIDAGHGGSDTGAIGYNTDGEAVLYEKDVNLKVANEVVSLLKDRGITVYSTRSSDVYVPLAGRTTYANNKGAQLFVSIHSNSFTNSDAHGTLTIYSQAKDELYPDKIPSKEVANIIQENLYQALDTYDRGITSEDELYVLRHSKMPAVLIELAFISNEADRAILADDSAMSNAAHSIADSIEYIINNQ